MFPILIPTSRILRLGTVLFQNILLEIKSGSSAWLNILSKVGTLLANCQVQEQVVIVIQPNVEVTRPSHLRYD